MPEALLRLLNVQEAKQVWGGAQVTDALLSTWEAVATTHPAVTKQAAWLFRWLRGSPLTTVRGLYCGLPSTRTAPGPAAAAGGAAADGATAPATAAAAAGTAGGTDSTKRKRVEEGASASAAVAGEGAVPAIPGREQLLRRRADVLAFATGSSRASDALFAQNGFHVVPDPAPKRITPTAENGLPASCMLASAASCFNQLRLPPWATEEEMAEGMRLSLLYGGGFGLA